MEGVTAKRREEYNENPQAARAEYIFLLPDIRTEYIFLPPAIVPPPAQSLFVVAKIFDYNCIFTILRRYQMENMLSKCKTILSLLRESLSILPVGVDKLSRVGMEFDWKITYYEMICFSNTIENMVKTLRFFF